MKYLFILLFCLWQTTFFAQQYSRVEYFIDIDPGLGMATSVAIPQVNSDSTEFIADLSTVSSGLHTLYIRVRDTAGYWSQTMRRPFLKQAVSVVNPATLVKAEYFIDTDPGFGQATPLTNFTGDSLQFTTDLSAISNGLHTIYIRTLDSYNHWSQTMRRPFLKTNISSVDLPNIVQAEYFIDTIGDFGSGIPIAITNPSTDVTADILADLSDIALGDHNLFVRAKDDAGKWSMIQNVAFQVCLDLRSEISESICASDSIFLQNAWQHSSGIYYDTLQTAGGCDSIVQTTLSIIPSYNQSISASICNGESYVLGSQTLTQSGDYSEVFQSELGCDSVVVLTLTVYSIYNEAITATICNGESYVFGAQALTESGEYTEVFQSEFSCDSTVVLTLTVNPIYNEAITATICNGESYVFGAQALTESGEYTEVFQSELGCDSTIILTLSVFQPDTSVTIFENALIANATDAAYQWIDCTNGNAAIEGETSQSFSPQITGIYALEITQQGCMDRSDCIPFTLVNVTDLSVIQNFEVYPNPATTKILLKDVGDLKIYNAVGNLVMQKKVLNNQQVDISMLAKGTYVLTLVNSNQIKTSRLIKH